MTRQKSGRKDASTDDIANRLWMAYKEKVIPLEERYKFVEFNSQPLGENDFTSNPMVLLIGQYSTGKTTFIRYLLGEDFPGMRIGPEPTTDRFVVVMHGEEDQQIPGNVAAIDPKLQFSPLTKFGSNFLSHFNCVFTKNTVLQNLTLIDTPGILSGEKQRVNRGYEFDSVLKWFAERVDKIIILFDAHKLDISDELASAIDAIKEKHSKVIVVLNKADGMENQQLLRVYGALMWNLSKIFKTPEVTRVFIGSFWDGPLVHTENKRLFELESKDLFDELSKLPRTCMIRRLDDTCARAHTVKIFACILVHLKNAMPMMMGKDSTKRQLINDLPDVFKTVSEKYRLALGDFPSVERMRDFLRQLDFKKIESYRSRLFNSLDDFLANDLPTLMRMHQTNQGEEVNFVSSQVTGGAFVNTETPFTASYDGINRGKHESGWIVEQYRQEWGDDFKSLCQGAKKMSGSVAKTALSQSKLTSNVLGKIWSLSDVDKDGYLDEDQYLLARYLIKLKKMNHDLPDALPPHLTPPSFLETQRETSETWPADTS